MNRSLKILAIDKYYFIKGGAERYYFEVNQILKSHGHQIIPFSMKHSDNFETEYEDYFVDNIEFNHKTQFERIWAAPKIIGRIIYSTHAQKQIEKLIEKEKPDIAHLHMIDHQLSPSILHSLKKYDIPVIQTVHQYKLVCPNYKFYNPGKGIICEKCINSHYLHPIFEKCHQDSALSGMLLALEAYVHKWMNIYKNVDLFHTPSTFMKTKMIEGGIDQSKIEKLYYSINISDYPFSPGFDDYFVYYGRLAYEKGVMTLLKTMKSITHSKLLIIGDGPQRKELEEFVNSHSIGNVKFLGNLDKDKLNSLVSKAKFVVVPSEWYDNSPLVIYESFCLGKAVIGSDLGGISELIDHEKNGLLFKAGDVDELTRLINRLLNNPDEIRLFGVNARKKAELEFDPNHHFTELMKLYGRILG